MTTAIIGVGLLGSALARNLVGGGEAVVLAARDEDHAARLANDLGPLARAASVSHAIAAADTVVFAVWLDMLTSLVSDNADVLKGKVVLDPTNPIRVDDSGALVRSLPEGQSAGSVVAGLLPPEAHYAKAFGSLGAASLEESTNRSPRRALLFYSSDDVQPPTTAQCLILAVG